MVAAATNVTDLVLGSDDLLAQVLSSLHQLALRASPVNKRFQRAVAASRLAAIAVCGDNVVDPPQEDCDEGGVNTASCDADCTLPACGDGLRPPQTTPIQKRLFVESSIPPQKATTYSSDHLVHLYTAIRMFGKRLSRMGCYGWVFHQVLVSLLRRDA